MGISILQDQPKDVQPHVTNNIPSSHQGCSGQIVRSRAGTSSHPRQKQDTLWIVWDRHPRKPQSSCPGLAISLCGIPVHPAR